MPVNSFVMHWLLMKVEDGVVVHDILGHAVFWSLGVFYLDNGLLDYQDPEWLRGALSILI